ncbi:hypothetical protein [Chitinophaga sp. 22620]|uniref:hypothetical protein n=1 Tax=Chitinophaga sp. 22620 TaxID=3453952 RepID=UPI003F8715BC
MKLKCTPIPFIKAGVLCMLSFMLFQAAKAQVPINRFSYNSTPKESGSAGEKAEIKKTETDKYFGIDSTGKDTTLKMEVLRETVSGWQNALRKPEDIYPWLSHHEQNLIAELRKRIGQYRDGRLSTIESNFAAHYSTKYNQELTGLDSIGSLLEKIRKGFESVNRIYGNPKANNWFFPGRNTIMTTTLYQRYNSSAVQVGTNIAFYGWENRGTVNPELVTFIAGPFRFALNTLISSTSNKDSTEARAEDAKLRTLTGNGGNLAFSVYLPIFYYSRAHFTAFVQASPKLVCEAPVLGSPFAADTLFGNFNLGADLNLSVYIPRLFNGSSLYAYIRPAYLIGTGPYLDALQLESNFYLMQSTVGIDIPKIGRIGFALPPITNAEKLKSNAFLLSFVVTPQNLIGN